MTAFFIKFFITVFCVIILSEIAKRINPDVAGIIMGLPLGAGISSFFFVYDEGVPFMMETVAWSIAGLSSTMIFAFSYLFAGHLGGNLRRIPQVCLTGICSVFVWGVFAFFLRQAAINLPVALGIFIIVFAGNLRVLRRFPFRGGRVSEKASSFKMILFRALVAGTTISLITGFARIIGPSWAGLAGAFPVMMFPLLLVLQFEDGQAAYPGVIHAFSYSITCLLLFYIGLYVLLPRAGLYPSYFILYPLLGLYLWRLGRFRSRRSVRRQL
jgi:hypothetical protein